jgi:hypothetical protein
MQRELEQLREEVRTLRIEVQELPSVRWRIATESLTHWKDQFPGV